MIGTVLRSRYELTNPIGDSPLFSSYAAKDRLLGRDVCVRIFKSPFDKEPALINAVSEICQRAGSVSSPFVERLYGVEIEDGPFLISELSRGSNLGDRVRKMAPYSVPVSISMIASLLGGLSALHKGAYVHGNVSFADACLLPDGSVKLQLSGLWEAFAASESAGSVMLPAMAATLAPEVSAGEAPSASSDIYGAGVILFHLLSGREPYPADSAVAMAMKHATAPTPSVRSINAGVPAALDALVKRAMAKEPSQRYTDADAMLKDLRAIEEAVRFGKQVSIPFPHPVADAHQPAAAIRSGNETPRHNVAITHDREPRDVPIWMLVTFASVFAVAVVLVALWAMFNLNAPRLVTVPDLNKRPVIEAKKIFDSLGLQMRVASRETSETIPADSILDINPNPGETVREGGIVVVKLSSGTRLVQVPDVRGRTVDEARSMLASLNLEVDDRLPERFDEKIAAGKISLQRPDPGRRVERFTKVSLVLSAGKRRQVREAPNLRFLYTLKIKLTGITESVLLRVEMIDAEGSKSIYEQTHFPEDEVIVREQGVGDRALFRIYYDGEMVSQVEKRADDPDSENSNPEVDPD